MIRQMTKRYRHALASAWVLLFGATTSWSQSLTWLGVLPGGYDSWAWDVSADGSVVVGGADDAAWQGRAFVWTLATGMQNIGTLGGDWSEAYGVSADGSVIVGGSSNAAGQERAFRWTQATGMQDLGTLGGPASRAWDVSADGSVVVGRAHAVQIGDASWRYHAFRWTLSDGMQDLGRLPGSNWRDWSEAYGVSADGSVVVGISWPDAFRWTASGGMQPLGAAEYGAAWSVSADGLVVVGEAYPGEPYRRNHAFRWTQATGMQFLGTLPGGDMSVAWDVSADGLIVVGTANATDGWPRAFRWTPSGGMENLNMTYARLLTSGSLLIEAYAISPNGRYVVGWGYNAATDRYEAYLLDTLCIAHTGDVNNDGCIDDTDLLAVLFASGETGQDLGRIDVNCDGVVDDSDALTILFNLGSGCE